jgi:hypothetical protein
MQELTITSPFVHSRVDSNNIYVGNPMPESISTLWQSRLYPPVSDFWFGLRECVVISVDETYDRMQEKGRFFVTSAAWGTLGTTQVPLPTESLILRVSICRWLNAIFPEDCSFHCST